MPESKETNQQEEGEINETENAAEEVKRSTSGDAADEALDLDLDDLDLTVETVEERISPSETNVFDK